MRRFIYTFTAVMILVMGMMFSGALAEGHEHGVCGEAGCAGEGHNVCADVVWTPWDGKTALTLVEGANNYYLTQDVEINTYINVARNQDFNLCLNGHTLTMTGSGCAVRTQWCFTLCDCTEGGKGAITHAAGVTGSGVETYGGGFYMYGGSITGNTAYRGAGVYVGAKSGIADSFYMYGGSISGNSAPKKIGNVTNNQGGYGGGVYLDVGSMIMYGGTIAGNTSEMYGGGIAQSVNATLSVREGSIRDNTSTYGGGINVAVSKKVTLENAVITGNSATQEGGGVFSAYSSSPATITMKNCTLTGNSAGKYGGAVSCCNLILKDCTIQENTAATSGGGVYATASLSIGGNMRVTGNALDSGAASNLYLYGKRIECTEPLTGGPGSVGIYASPDEGTPAPFMTGATEADLSALTCDRTTAYAGIYNDIVYFSIFPIGNHSHDGVEYSWWPAGIPVLTEGDNYYFINDYMSMSYRPVTIAEGQTLYLCLNGQTINYYGDTALFNVGGGKLVICSCADGGKVEGRTFLIENDADGITMLKDVSVGGQSVSEDWLISNQGTLDAENTVIGPSRYAQNAVFVNEGTAVISGGTIGAQAYSANTPHPVIDNAGTLTLAGGVNVFADANLSGISNRAGASLVIEKGSVTGAAKGIVNNGSLEICGDAANALTGNTLAIENSGTAIVNGGAVTGNVTGVSVADGSFTLTGSASVHGNTGEGASDIAVTGGSFILKDTSALIGVPAMKVGLEDGCLIEVSGALKRSLQVNHALLEQDSARANLLCRLDGEVTDADIAKLSLMEPGDYAVRVNPNNTAFAEAYIPERVYAITYDLAGGALPEGSRNPADYTSEDPTFVIANPVKRCYTFGGWTTADITDPMPEVTIYSGSEGPIALTANWVFAGHELAMDAAFAETDIGGQVILHASRSCSHADDVDITWSVSDEDMLHLDGVSAGNDGSEARLTALMPGCTTVVARTAEGSCAVCDVIVHSDVQMVLPADTVSVRDAAFEGVSAVEIVLPEGITSIGSRAFADCENLLIINIPAGVTVIADDAFEESENLILVCEKGSTAEKFAQDRGIACVCR